MAKELEDFDLFGEASDQAAYAKAKEAEDARLLAIHRATLPEGYVGKIPFLSLGD